MKFRTFIVLSIFCCHLISDTTSDCRVELPKDASLKPAFFKAIGSREASVTNEVAWIDLQDGEKIMAHCDTKFTKPKSFSDSNVSIVCSGHQISGYYSGDVLFECDSLKWNLYESSTPFRWCPPYMASYILARPLYSGYEYLAGICYNFDEMTIQSMHYAVSPNMKNVYPLKLRSYTPVLQIPNIGISFVFRNISVNLYDNPQVQQWVQFANFHNHSLVQNHAQYQHTYQQFSGLLEFIWWSGLRLGNWRLYEEALAYHLTTTTFGYDIFAGISGVVSVPVFNERCQKNRTLIELVDRTNRKIPLYVWQYLKSPRNDNDSLVVIGVNSPFEEFYNEKDIIFCTDVCSHIDWLQNVYSTFRYKAMGIVFCCTVSDVQSSKRLHGFPAAPRPVKVTPKPVPTTKTPYNSYEDDVDTAGEGGINDDVNDNINEY